jgi:acyl transferase domain-containing protein
LFEKENEMDTQKAVAMVMENMVYTARDLERAEEKVRELRAKLAAQDKFVQTKDVEELKPVWILYQQVKGA